MQHAQHTLLVACYGVGLLAHWVKVFREARRSLIPLVLSLHLARLLVRCRAVCDLLAFGVAAASVHEHSLLRIVFATGRQSLVIKSELWAFLLRSLFFVRISLLEDVPVGDSLPIGKEVVYAVRTG